MFKCNQSRENWTNLVLAPQRTSSPFIFFIIKSITCVEAVHCETHTHQSQKLTELKVIQSSYE